MEILKLFYENQPDEELHEIKQVLSEYLFRKAVKLADEAFEEKGYTTKDIEEWKDEPSRINKNVNESSY